MTAKVFRNAVPCDRSDARLPTMRRRSLIGLMAGALVLAACGSPADQAGSQSSPDSTAPATAGAAAVETAASDPTGDPITETTPMTSPESESAVGEAATTDATAPGETTEITAEPAATTPATTPATGSPAPARPDDGCSADNTSTPTDVADGPVPAIDVLAASASNPLPDIAVRRINCAGGWVNLKNELPADTPLLVWFWAPH